MRESVKKILGKFGLQITRTNKKDPKNEIISLKPDTQSIGSVLVCYMIEPFLRRKGEKISIKHPEHQMSYLITQAFLSMGYSVDVVDKNNRNFTPQKRYNMFFGTRANFQRIAEQINGDCINIMFMDMAHWLNNNKAALHRCFDLRKRRGVALGSYKMKEQDYADRYADFILSGGNEYNVSTYKFTDKPIICNPSLSFSLNTYDFPEKKDFSTSRKKFVWFGSSGLIHKGLDLVLEAFSELPELELYVCGPVSKEPEFEEEYYRELYNTPNITTVGWVDVDSQNFKDIMNDAISVVFPSCSEAGCTSVLTCMQIGLIPIISYETAITVDDTYGFLLKESTIEEIKKRVVHLSELPEQKLNEMSRSAWEYARKNHTKDRLVSDFTKTIHEIVHKMDEKKTSKEKNMRYRGGVEWRQ